MDTITILTIAHIIVAILLMIVVLAQSKGAGLSQTFGGGSAGATHVKRGPEKFMYYTTIVLAVLFVGLGIVNLFIQ